MIAAHRLPQMSHPVRPETPLRAAPIDYYKSVKRFATSIVLACLVLLAGCNSSHPPRIGSTAPDFTIANADRTVSLSQFRGKPVLLNFWASWCGPCVEETPSLVELQKQLGNKVTVIAVSEDADESAYKQFIRDHNVDLLTVRDTGRHRTNEIYGTFKYPETFVIDSNGKVVRKFIGATDWTSPDIIDYLKKL
jgi:cytochrome c biogenesis protein CcmG, thiol:disulfide interchange protein DsbE